MINLLLVFAVSLELICFYLTKQNEPLGDTSWRGQWALKTSNCQMTENCFLTESTFLGSSKEGFPDALQRSLRTKGWWRWRWWEKTPDHSHVCFLFTCSVKPLSKLNPLLAFLESNCNTDQSFVLFCFVFVWLYFVYVCVFCLFGFFVASFTP